MSTRLRVQQTRAIALIRITTERYVLIYHFCGTGKSRIIRECVGDHPRKLRVVVLPSSALAAQFEMQYATTGNDRVFVLNTDKSNNTNLRELEVFLRASTGGVIAANVQSLHHLVALTKQEWCPSVEMLCLDEAHHYTEKSPAWWPSVRAIMSYAKKTVLFTATPTPSQRIAYANATDTYTYHDGVNDLIIKEFELVCDVTPSNNNKEIGTIANSLVRAVKKYGRRRIIIFHRNANDCERTGSSVAGLDVAAIHTAFLKAGLGHVRVSKLTGNTSAEERKEIFDAFRRDDDGIQIISNCQIVKEGVDLPCADMAFMADPKGSETAVVQAIGRVCRKGGRNEKGIVFIPIRVCLDKYIAAKTDKERTQTIVQACKENGDFSPMVKIMAALKLNGINVSLPAGSGTTSPNGSSKTCDGKSRPSSPVNINNRHPVKAHVNFSGFDELSLSLKDGLQGELRMMIINKNTSPEEKAHMLVAYAEEHNTPPKQNVIKDGIQLGQFWSSMKAAGQCKEQYESIVSKNAILKQDYNRCQQAKKKKKKVSSTEKAHMLVAYAEEHKTHPKQNVIKDGIRLGQFWMTMKTGCCKTQYESIVSKNAILKKDYEICQQKKKVSSTEKAHMLVAYAEEHDKPPKKRLIKDGIQLGLFWSSMKTDRCKEQYESIVSNNAILKKDYDMCQLKKEKKNKVSTTEKAHMLVAYAEEHNTHPKQNVIEDGIQLGMFWKHMKAGTNKEQYESIVSKNAILKQDYDMCQLKKKKKVSTTEKAHMLVAYAEEHNTHPKKRVIKDGIQLGVFWKDMKASGNKEQYESIVSKNAILKQDYDRYQQKKKARAAKKATMGQTKNFKTKKSKTKKSKKNPNSIVSSSPPTNTIVTSPVVYGETHSKEHREWKTKMNNALVEHMRSHGLLGQPVVVIDDDKYPPLGTSRTVLAAAPDTRVTCINNSEEACANLRLLPEVEAGSVEVVYENAVDYAKNGSAIADAGGFYFDFCGFVDLSSEAIRAVRKRRPNGNYIVGFTFTTARDAAAHLSGHKIIQATQGLVCIGSHVYPTSQMQTYFFYSSHNNNVC